MSLRKACLAVLLTGFLLPGFARAQTNTPVAGNTAFAFDLYAQLKAGDENLFFSPYSISTCLAMTFAGARGETEKQMAQALHFETNQAALHAEFGELQKRLNEVQQKQEIELNIANGLWGQKGHVFLKTFLGIADKMYAANLKQADFRTGAETARKEINDWVSGKTRGKIAGLLPPGTLDASTRLVLVNAIYFKGTWAEPFQKSKTADTAFITAAGKPLQTAMMNQTGTFNYAAAEGWRLLELPYKGGDLAMVILLPRETNGLPALEQAVSAEKLTDWLMKGRKQKVNVFLPRLKMTRQFDLTKTLTGMGMAEPFSARADFSGMDGAKDLFISAVVHKALVEVNEEGTEAAAATGAIMALTSAMRPQPIPVFRADHPFIFLIRDVRSGSVLFMGRVTDPTK